MGIRSAAIILLVLQTWTLVVRTGSGQFAGEALKMYVNKLPKIPKIYGYRTTPDGVRVPANLTLGMYKKYWKFHRDLAAAPVFVYGTSAETATFPGPCIEALQGVPTYVTWENHLPRSHILPWDPTVPTAIPRKGGVPGVVHLHGGIHEPQSDGSALAWFTAGFQEKGPSWSKPTYTYPNVQHPGNLWYHDHTLGLTRASILAGLLGPYVIRNPRVEDAYGLPSGRNFDRHLVIADRSFNRDGSIYMNYTGNNPSVHPQWRPEYFGDAVTVNGKAWPYLKVQRRRYRFRILNASNARYFRLALSNGMSFTVIGSDTSYLSAPVTVSSVVVATGEVFDVVVDFSMVSSTCQEIEMTNNAPYPYPNGTIPALPVTKVMKFLVQNNATVSDKSRVPVRLADHLPRAAAAEAVKKRYIVMYEYLSSTGSPTHLLINGKRLTDPVTETPKSGSTELWEVINLTPDDHPLHIHLGNLQAIKVQRLINVTDFADCMKHLNDAVKCDVDLHATGQIVGVPRHERTWKYVVKVEPFTVTTVIVKFNLIESNKPYPFDASVEPGFVYHCHILDHEDNEMIRPLKLVA